jgi:hypothetical protein
MLASFDSVVGTAGRCQRRPDPSETFPLQLFLWKFFAISLVSRYTEEGHVVNLCSIFYNASLPLLDYTDRRAIAERAGGKLDTMVIEDKKRTAYRALVTQVLEGDGRASRAARRSAFENSGLDEPLSTMIDKVARQPARVTDEDIAAVLASGISEDQTFELVICSAIGAATRQYESAIHALEEALNDTGVSEHASEHPE